MNSNASAVLLLINSAASFTFIGFFSHSMWALVILFARFQARLFWVSYKFSMYSHLILPIFYTSITVDWFFLPKLLRTSLSICAASSITYMFRLDCAGSGKYAFPSLKSAPSRLHIVMFAGRPSNVIYTISIPISSKRTSASLVSAARSSAFRPAPKK